MCVNVFFGTTLSVLNYIVLTTVPYCEDKMEYSRSGIARLPHSHLYILVLPSIGQYLQSLLCMLIIVSRKTLVWREKLLWMIMIKKLFTRTVALTL